MTFILFILILSILVFVHEFGHFLMAKKSGILVEEFGFGLPPKIWSKKIGETVYSINLLPIGGFVRLYGENEAEDLDFKTKKIELKGRAFFEKNISQRLKVILAGVSMNYLLAIFVFAVVYTIAGIPTKINKIKVVGIAKDSPAFFAGLQEGDIVVSLDREKIEDVENFIKLTKNKAGKLVVLEIKREKSNPCLNNSKVLGGGFPSEEKISCLDGNLLVSLVPRKEPPEGEGPLGVAITDVEMKYYSSWIMPILGVREGFKESLAWGKMVLNSLFLMVKDLVYFKKAPKGVTGPIGIYQATGVVAKSGMLAIFEFLGILSVNLAIINILPFPALDGGRLLFLGIEKLRGKKVTPATEAWINNLGMIFLLFLVLLVTINDVVRILLESGIIEKLRIIF